MSRRTTITIAIIVLSLIIGSFLGFYFYISSKTPGTSTPTNSTNSGFFGFFGGNKQQPAIITSPTTESSSSPLEVNAPIVIIPRLRHVDRFPVAGHDFIIKNIYATSTDIVASTTASSTKKVAPKIPKVIGTQEVFRWIERGTGNIFESSTSTLATSRLSNTTITQIYSALFTDGGNSLLLRGLVDTTDTIKTQYGQLQEVSPTSTDQMLMLKSLPLNITSLSLSPDKTKIFYTLPTNIRGMISRTDGSSKTTAFTSPFSEWLTDWPTASSIVLTTKPSATVEGYAYTLNPQTFGFSKILGNKNGLTTLMSPDGSKVLYSESPQGSLQLSILDRKTNTTKQVFIKTLPEKCVWSKNNTDILYCAVPTNLPFLNYPDVWYQGLINFSDTLWKIDVKTGETLQILTPITYTSNPLDMTELTLSTKEDSLLFTDKNDLSLWEYQLVLPTTPTIGPVATTTATSSKK